MIRFLYGGKLVPSENQPSNFLILLLGEWTEENGRTEINGGWRSIPNI